MQIIAHQQYNNHVNHAANIFQQQGEFTLTKWMNSESDFQCLHEHLNLFLLCIILREFFLARVCHLALEVKEIIIPLRISSGRGAMAGIVCGESKLEAKSGAILFQT